MLGSLAALAGTLVIAADRTGMKAHTPAAASPAVEPPSHVAAAAAAAAAGQEAWAAGAGAAAAAAAAAAASAASAASAGPTPAASLLGDGLIVCAALCYSASTVRIPAWAVHRGVPSLHLALGKSAFLAAVSFAALAVQAWHLAASGGAAGDLWPGWRRSVAGWALIAWSALGPGALAAFLHVKVRWGPSLAQLLSFRPGCSFRAYLKLVWCPSNLTSCTALAASCIWV